MSKSKRANACDISPKVRERVRDRDGGQCVYCGRPGEPNAHFISRARHGLGIEQNVCCLCAQCHYDLDHGKNEKLQMEIEAAMWDTLTYHYPGFPDEKRIYDKYAWLKEK